MAAGAAELVDHILPHVAVRQWVLSLPRPLRYRLAWDHVLCRAVLTIYTRVLLGFERRRGRRRGIGDGRSGTVTAIQRFGSGIQLNVHFHTLVLEGVFATTPDGTVRFDPAPPPTDREVARLLATVRTRILRLLRRRGVLATEDAADIEADPLAADTPCSRSSARPPSAAGRRSGTGPARRCCASPTPPMRRGCGRSVRATRTSSASISMPIAPSAPMTVSGSKDSAGTSCAHRSRKSGSRASPTAASSARFATRGMTARAT
jgi:hypothetical protein